MQHGGWLGGRGVFFLAGLLLGLFLGLSWQPLLEASLGTSVLFRITVTPASLAILSLWPNLATAVNNLSC